MSKVLIGIDLGTTNSEVAVLRNGVVEIVEEEGSSIMPSCVGLSDDGRLLVGQEARNQYVFRPEHTIRSIKRKMGSEAVLELGDKLFSPTEISAMIIKALKARAERALGQPVDGAVITVPAYFSDAQRQATREAGVLAGLEVERILNEPTAAALAYEAAGVDGAKTVLVFDLGGGTFDASVVHMENELVEVLRSHGDNRLGGDDVDELLFEHALERIQEAHENVALDASGANRLRLSLEELKARLSEAATAVLAENALTTVGGKDPLPFKWDLDRSTFEDWVAPLLSRTLHSVRTVLGHAGLSASDLDEVLLVGGATRMPLVGELLEKELGLRPRTDLHPDLAVAFGAGVMAARAMGDQKHRILVDVTPYTFGTSCYGELEGEYVTHLLIPIIKAGSPVPAKKGQIFYTMYPGQEGVDVRIFQGENPDARENIFIGNFTIENLDIDAPEGSEILLNMSLNIDGILQVTAVERHTGLTKSVVMKNACEKQTKASIRKSRERIAALFEAEAPLETIETPSANKGNREQNELLRRVDRCLPDLDEVDARDIELARQAYLQAVEVSDDVAVERARLEIEDILFYIESK